MCNEILENEMSISYLKTELNGVFNMMVNTFEQGGTLFICGNGGSFADSIHIAGELVKSFERERPVSEGDRKSLAGLFGGEILIKHLEQGLPAVALGTNQSLCTALLNDSDEKELLFAQELYVIGCAQDTLLALSTSGNARDVLLAVSVAKAMNIKTAALTGKGGGLLERAVDISITVKQDTTREVQQVHQVIYHTLCRMLEDHFFGRV